MWLERPRRHDLLGAVRIHESIQVVQLDSGSARSPDRLVGGRRIAHIAPATLRGAERDMVIVIPTKNERPKVIEGVLSAIPHDCTIALVSASERRSVDRFALETGLLSDLCAATGRRAVAIHQDDPDLARAVDAAGLGSAVSEGRMRPGKGEAMLVGAILADVLGAATIGYVDSDNYVPGAVHEYVKVFAAGLRIFPNTEVMVRISWQSKPKISSDQVVFNRWGRTSRITNEFLNLLLSAHVGHRTEVIHTGNAGDHAMTMGLARRLPFASGFAVEPYELIHLFEAHGGVLPSHPGVSRPGVDVVQVETRNPHFHEDRGDRHVANMRTQALHVIYHSPLCPEWLRTDIVRFLSEATGQTAVPPKELIHPPIEKADRDALARALPEIESLRLFSMGSLQGL